jgi:glucosyl-dolichyl phosphate glucuronosyltransferase
MQNCLLSVIIPTLNRSKSLLTLLDSLALQKQVPFGWEILVVDNGSTDDTRDEVKKIISKMPVPLRYFYESKPGLHQGRHCGAQNAIGEVIAFLDDDTILSPQWISGVELILSKQADAVVSRILPSWEIPPPEWLINLINEGTFGLLTLLDIGYKPKRIDPSYVWGASFFIRHSLIFELGGFHPDGMPLEMLRYRGDGESGFFRKFKNQGYIAWYDPQSVAYHRVPRERMTLEYLLKRSYNQGISDSFTQIRRSAGLDGIQVSRLSGINQESFRVILRWLREVSFLDRLVWFSKKILRAGRRLLPISSNEIQHQLTAANRAGWKFHQSSVEADPELLEFVLKKTFLE